MCEHERTKNASQTRVRRGKLFFYIEKANIVYQTAENETHTSRIVQNLHTT